MSLPESYAHLQLPCIRLAHHPASSPTVTPVVVVLLDRPAAKNAFNLQMAQSLIKAFDMLSADPRVRAVVLSGSDTKNRMFCAGADLDMSFGSQPDSEPETRTSHRDSGGAVSLSIFRCNKPVIAALNGSAVGVGITMTLAADIRVASRDARYGFVFGRRGLVLEACSSFFLPRLVGTSAAAYLVTTGAALPPTHAALAPLFADVVAPADVLSTALGLADDIAANMSPVSTRVMRDMLYRNASSPEEAHLVESNLLFQRFASADFAEGILSFKERRAPRFPETVEADAPAGWPWWDTGVLARANAAEEKKQKSRL